MLVTIILLVLIGLFSAILGSLVGIGGVSLLFQHWYTWALHTMFYMVLHHK